MDVFSGQGGWESDPTRRFGDRVNEYAAHRPSYPREAMDAVVEGVDAGRWVADVGAGTGISTRLLLERGLRVAAIEPNGPMRERGAAETARFGPRVRWEDATGEHTGLDDASVSLVLCAQSLHWLDGERAVREFARVLAPGGVAAAVWNVHDVRDEMMAAYRDVVMRHARDVPRSPWFRGEDCVLGSAAARGAGLGRYERREFPNRHAVSREGLIGRAVSASYMPRDGEGRAAVERELSDLFDRHERGGVVVMRYVCEVHRAVRG